MVEIALARDGLNMRIPAGSIIYDVPVIDPYALVECKSRINTRALMTLEPIMVLANIYFEGKAVLKNRFVVIGPGALVTEKPFCSSTYLEAIRDAWGEAHVLEDGWT